MKFNKLVVAAVLVVGMTSGVCGTVLAANTLANGGGFIDMNNLTWEANDGTTIAFGRGSVFSDVHPEITDPEYYLKEMTIYPEENLTSATNSQGFQKSCFNAETVAELQRFVNSFDWIHSDEMTRAQMVHDRISNGHNGNCYAVPERQTFAVLMDGHGMCRNFSDEFADLCKLVGLECVTYTPSDNHQACLLKIGNQWFATDPTVTEMFLSNTKTYPVDYETELHRFERECEAEQERCLEENPNDPVMLISLWNQQFAAGEIAERELDARLNELMQQMAK